MAQRVVRRVHRQPGHRRRHGVRRRVGRQLLRAPPVGAGRRPAAEHPPGRRQRRRRRQSRRCRTSTGSPTPRARDPAPAQRHRWATTCSSRASSTTSSGTGSATPRCTTCSRAGSAPGPATCPSFTDNWLRTAGPDTIALDRAAGVDPSYAARGPPRRPAAPDPRGGRADGRHLDRPRAEIWTRPETPFDAGDRPVLLDPYNDTWALLIPDKLTMDALETLLPRHRRTRCCAPGSGATSAAPCTTPRSTRSTCSTSPWRACPIEDTEDTRRRTMAWVYGWVVPLQPDPARPRWPGCTTAARAKLDAAAPDVRGAAGGVPRRDPHRVRRRRCCRRGCDGPDLPEGVPLDLDLRWRVAGPARRRSARPTSPSWTASSRPSPPAAARVHHTRARASLPTRRRRRGPGRCFTGEIDLPNYELEAAGLRHLARRPGGAHRAVRRALLRRPARHRPGAQRAGCSPRPPRTSSRGPR